MRSEQSSLHRGAECEHSSLTNYPLSYPKYPLLRTTRALLKGTWGSCKSEDVKTLNCIHCGSIVRSLLVDSTTPHPIIIPTYFISRARPYLWYEGPNMLQSSNMHLSSDMLIVAVSAQVH